MVCGLPARWFSGEPLADGSSLDQAFDDTMGIIVQGAKGKTAPTAPTAPTAHSNLIGMGVLPLQFRGDDSWQTLGLRGDEIINIELPAGEPRPLGEATLIIRRGDSSTQRVTVVLRIDTPIEVDCYKHGGILPFVLRQLLDAA